jgi:alanyl-tRNA synthetase
MFYDVTLHGLGELTHEQYVEADDRGDLVEIWNDVFMEYEKENGQVIGKLAQKNVDTGSGLERITMIVQGKSNVYEGDLFAPIINKIKEITNRWGGTYDERAARIIADHIRTSVFLIADGVLPSNKDQGYILRRLLRRAIRYADQIGFSQGISSTNSDLSHLAEVVVQVYAGSPYSLELGKKATELIFSEIENEEKKFRKTLNQGLKEFEKGTDAFTLFTTYGFPIELTMELAQEKNKEIDLAGFHIQMKAHQDASRSGAAAKFKGGLADTGEETTKLHTAHHLLLAALQKVLGPEVHQRGSNITPERLRIDFNFDRKMTDEEKKAVEDQVNIWIQTNHTVCRREMPRAEAEQLGAEMEFGTKYPDIVSIYVIEDENGNTISKEFCGGPHVEQTSGIGTFKIQKEEAVAAGIRRIKATLS